MTIDGGAGMGLTVSQRLMQLLDLCPFINLRGHSPTPTQHTGVYRVSVISIPRGEDHIKY
jgi:hypothetical protein